MQSAAWMAQWFARWRAPRGTVVAMVLAAHLGAAVAASANDCATSTQTPEQLKQLDVHGWLERMRQAMELQTYSGNFVVTSSSGVMSSSRVWHVCKNHRQIERIEALSGTPRVVFRQSADVRTFMPNERVVRVESRELPNRFPQAKGIDAESLSTSYTAQLGGQERIAGMEADVLQLRPRDTLRFGYRIWVDRNSGLVLKWQTIAPSGRVLEQAAFSELEMSAPASGAQIESMMNDVVGYRILKEPRLPATLEANGWQLPIPVDGFVLLNCTQKQKMRPQPLRKARVQCVYSDGLATISVFLEPFSDERHAYEGQELRLGATHTLSGRVVDDSWVTMVGEVPLATLRRFASAIKQTSEH